MRFRHSLRMAALWLPAIGFAQTSASPALSLADAERRLLDANPAILQARAAVAGARADILSAGARPNPTLSASVSSINPSRKGSGGYWERPVDNVLRIDQVLERGDKRELRLRAAGHGAAAAEADLSNTIRLARMDLANAWLDLRAAQEISRIANENARLAARAADAAELRGKAGDLAGVDVARIRADAARVANDALQAGLDLSSARIALNLLLGSPTPPEQLRAAEEWPSVPPPQAGGDAERADLSAARLRVEQAAALRELVRAQQSRDVSVGVQYEHNPPDGRNTYGLSLSVPLLLGNDYRGDIARREADYGAAEQQLIATRAAVQGELSRLRAELDARAARYARIHDLALPAAEKAGRGADVAIQKGGMSLTDYLDTQRSLRAARIEAVQARADLARAELMLRLAGESP